MYCSHKNHVRYLFDPYNKFRFILKSEVHILFIIPSYIKFYAPKYYGSKARSKIQNKNT